MSTLEDLPKNWVTTTVGEVAAYQNGRAFKPSEWTATGLPIIRIQNLNDSNAIYHFSDKRHEERFRVNNGDLLFAWSASLGSYIWRGRDAWLNQHIFRVDHAPMIDRQFLYYALTNMTAELYAKAHGSGMVHVTKRRFEETSLRLPPLSEQCRIVAKIDELFSELDKGIESLRIVRRQLAVYRQSVLKYAFEGKLTAEWRAQNKDKIETPKQLLARIKRERKERYEEQLKEWNGAVKEWENHGKIGARPSKPKVPEEPTGVSDKINPKLPKIPAGWRWFRLGSIADVVGGITKNQTRIRLPHMMRYLRVANVYADMILAENVHEIGVSKAEARKVALKVGDLLVVEGNGSIDQIGRVAMWNGELAVCGHQNHLIRVRIANGLNPRFWLRFLLSPQGRSLIVKEAKSTSGLHTLSISKVSNLNVPVASAYEEAEVLARIDEKLAGTDQTIELVDRQLAKSAALRAFCKICEVAFFRVEATEALGRVETSPLSVG